ncbi:FliM/FliN family flagellar motor switch protein [Paraburkholderia sp. UYCP14C]|uniref:FliM/FliN family flagellar motor C-terminal domain-containing protein n=1 Tax=Paraburkholderia sp. UYCP14C TaxID=2511130 RepID=UPI001020F354|nr:FliM/FliN family flagellar motor C-terminal domain-containing protein [Paraburkholderia sp. UYCP14C]RZF29075.1 FliM/FliN family flagellar motor switch protein [Paraburkholderia sp. UYCP14C]
MSVEPIHWRPLGGRDLAAGAAWLTSALAPWQQAWLATPALMVEAVALLDPSDSVRCSDQCESWSIGDDVWLFAEPRQIAMLVNEALDLPKSFALTGHACAPVLADVGTLLVDELLDAIGAALSPERETAADLIKTSNVDTPRLRYGGASFRLRNASGESVLTLVCGAPTLWSRLPLSNPPVHAANTRAESLRSTAVGSSRVSLHAMLGQCELSVPQLATLAVGDVIRLDHTITEPIALQLAQSDRGRPIPIAAGMPGQHGGKFSIQLTSIAAPATP